MATGVCQGLAPSNGATFADVGKMLGVTTGLTSKLQAPALVPRFQGLGVSAGLTSKLQTGALLPRLQGLGVTAGLTSKLQTAALVPRFQGLGVSAGLTSKLQTGALVPRFQGLGVTAGPTTKLKTPALAPDLGGLGIAAGFAGTLEVPTFRVLNPSSTLAAIQLPARRVSKVRDGGLGELARYADYLEHHPLKEYRDAGAFLRKALRAIEHPEDKYTYADVAHWAVGALEEVACQLPGVRAKDSLNNSPERVSRCDHGA